mmetsp:Transcript_8383/g.23846  ORF Transcript_8383/g.23846 Transcript_8383/m.23846 type:complete len:220 (-) Transcript_8383:38-697(-)
MVETLMAVHAEGEAARRALRLTLAEGVEERRVALQLMNRQAVQIKHIQVSVIDQLHLPQMQTEVVSLLVRRLELGEEAMHLRHPLHEIASLQTALYALTEVLGQLVAKNQVVLFLPGQLLVLLLTHKDPVSGSACPNPRQEVDRNGQLVEQTLHVPDDLCVRDERCSRRGIYIPPEHIHRLLAIAFSPSADSEAAGTAAAAAAAAAGGGGGGGGWVSGL